MSHVILTPKQSDAVTRLARWFASLSAPQIFEIAGFAGVGKSTVVKYAIQALGLGDDEVVYLAFTGRASLILTRKGNPAQTIHRFCYEPKISKYKCPYTGLTKEKVVGFQLKKYEPEQLPKLIVVDEVSMVGEHLLNDLLSFGVKVLVLGDPAQLPPVLAKSNGLLVQPDVFLDEIHRQAADNPIIWASMRARQGHHIPYGQHGAELKVVPRAQVTVDDVLQADQVIACTHNTRRLYNHAVRDYLGYAQALPATGEKLICLSNRWEDLSCQSFTPLVNGLTVRVVEEPYNISRNLRSFWSSFEIEGVAGDRFTAMETNLDWFEPLPAQPPDTDGAVAHFDFGYAITTYKAQGGEYDNVLYINDAWGSPKERAQHLYTGVTRAAKMLTIAL